MTMRRNSHFALTIAGFAAFAHPMAGGPLPH